jgi:DNA repair ATPase RecN
MAWKHETALNMYHRATDKLLYCRKALEKSVSRADAHQVRVKELEEESMQRQEWERVLQEQIKKLAEENARLSGSKAATDVKTCIDGANDDTRHDTQAIAGEWYHLY